VLLISAEKVSFFSPSVMANIASKVEKEATDIRKGLVVAYLNVVTIL
jgi:hypothetical protein